jgi:hypothetical protein
MIRSFIHHHKYDRVFLKGRTQILFFKRKRKPEMFYFPPHEMALRDRTLAVPGCFFIFFYFIFFRVVQYEERDSIVMAPQQQRSAQM